MQGGYKIPIILFSTFVVHPKMIQCVIGDYRGHRKRWNNNKFHGVQWDGKRMMMEADILCFHNDTTNVIDILEAKMGDLRGKAIGNTNSPALNITRDTAKGSECRVAGTHGFVPWGFETDGIHLET